MPSAPPPPQSPATPRPVHWLVRMNRRNRSAFYAMLGVAVGSHLWHAYPGAGQGVWAIVALQFYAYPQFAYWRAVHSARQRRTEMQNLWLDALFGGLWAGALGLPVWLGFALVIGNCINMVVFYGLAGLPRLLLSTGAGIAAAAGGWMLWAGHWPLRPETDLPTSLACVVALIVYFIAFAHDGYVRAMQQHRSHEQLRAQFDEIQSLQARLHEQAVRDPLTGLFNRRQLDADLGPAIERSLAVGQPLSVLMIDIDHFKRINDTHGHPAGDAVLVALAGLLLQHAGPDDMACRHGGEEFVLVLAGTGPAAATARAQSLRQAFAALPVRIGTQTVHATLSCGIATSPADGDQPLALIACADRALYAAKMQGRDRVVQLPAQAAWPTEGARAGT